jgi:hypothetical protein
MKKYLFGFIIFVILVLVFFFFFFKKDKKVESLPKSNSFASVLEKSFYVDGLEQKREITEKTEVLEGEEVVTDSTGRGIIESLSGSVTVVDYSTRFKINKNREKPAEESIFLSSGNLWSRVSKVFGKGEFYEIETKNAVAIVRGTSFGVSYINKNTIIKVTEGKVFVVPVSTTTRERFYDKGIFVSLGYKAIVDENLKISISEITSNDKKDPWYIYNNQPSLPYQKVLNTNNNSQPVSQQVSGTTSPNTTTNTNTNTGQTGNTGTSGGTGGATGGSAGGGVVPTTSTLTVRSITPKSVYQGEDVTISGTGFNKVTGLSLDIYVIPKISLTIVDDNTLRFNVGDIGAGTYPISIVDSDNNIVTIQRAVTVNNIPYDPATYGP